MLAADLVARHPYVFHTADARAWPSIQARGLLPTAMLRELVAAEEGGPRRLTTAYTVEGPDGHIVVIRDQQPLKFLAEVVDEDTTTQEFLDILDARCYFWASEERMRRLLLGKNYRDTPQVVLTVSTASLLRTYGDVVELSPYNSGSAHVPNAPRRGRTTFTRVADYDYDRWRKKRGRSGDAVVEVTVPGPIPDLMQHVTDVRRFPGPDFRAAGA